jgi:DNA repair exonuclease SbcCD nuclease subunit
MSLSPEPARDLVVVHSSDLHVDHDYTARLHGGDGAAGLACVLNAACGVAADVVILAGDTFENHRVPQDLIERAAAVMAAAAMPIVILPGNHDPAVGEAIYRGSALAAVTNLHVIGVTHDDSIVFPALSLEVWGRAHRDYGDMIPLEIGRRRAPRQTRWQIAVAHGHYEPAPDRSKGRAPLGSLPMLRSRPRAPITSRWAIGIKPRASATARCRRIIPARPNMPVPLMSCA